MTKTFTTILLLVISWQAISQSYITKIDKYITTDTIEGVKVVLIKMPFGKSNIISLQGDTAELQASTEMKIDIVCTDFPSNLSLTHLNKERLQTLYRLFPFLMPIAPRQNIQIVRQMDGAEKEKAQVMFHGIVIRYKLPQTKKTMVHDLLKLREMIGAGDTSDNLRTIDSSIAAQKISKKAIPGSLTTPWRDSLVISDTVARHKDPYVIFYKLSPKEIKNWGLDTGCYKTLTPKKAVKDGYISKKQYNGYSFEASEKDSIKTMTKVGGWKHQDSIMIIFCPPISVRDTLVSTEAKGYVEIPQKKSLPDSTIFAIFRRNKWKHMDIVGDITGSMYPYTAQLLLWLKLQSLDSLTSDYSFFNDGDDLPDKKKHLGRTGGIYSATCHSYQQVENLITTAMLHGSGGDAPENNVEALIDAEKKFPGNNFHVLIADNWAPVKDLSLASQLTKPVRVVLCGVYNDEINTNYLDLAWATHGSVHLVEQDLTNLASLHEGETITIGKKEYKIINGHFKDVHEPSVKMHEL